MLDEKKLEEWIEGLDSDQSVVRISSRVNLLRVFPDNGDSEERKRLYFDLWKDVQTNPDQAVDFVSGISDINDKAYASYFISAPLSISRGERERKMDDREQQELKEKDARRKRFVGVVEGLGERVGEIERFDPKLEVLQIIAEEGSLERALVAVDQVGQLGCSSTFYDPFYERGNIWHIHSVADKLEEIAEYSGEQPVRFRALDLLAEISDEKKREEHLEHMICAKVSDVASRAVDLYVEKVRPYGEKDKSRVAAEAIFAKVRNIDGSALRTANPRAIERAFNLVMEYTPQEKRLETAYGLFDSNLFTNSVRKDSPAALAPIVLLYLKQHVDDINSVKDRSNRQRILGELVIRGGESALKAVDYLANTPEDPMDGVENIAILYTNGNFRTAMNDDTRYRVVDWAVKFTKQFVNLQDKKLARGCLYQIRGYESADFPGEYEEAHGRREIDPESGKRYDLIAIEELAKLPAEPKKADKLKKVFSGK